MPLGARALGSFRLGEPLAKTTLTHVEYLDGLASLVAAGFTRAQAEQILGGPRKPYQNGADVATATLSHVGHGKRVDSAVGSGEDAFKASNKIDKSNAFDVNDVNQGSEAQGLHTEDDARAAKAMSCECGNHRSIEAHAAVDLALGDREANAKAATAVEHEHGRVWGVDP